MGRSLLEKVRSLLLADSADQSPNVRGSVVRQSTQLSCSAATSQRSTSGAHRASTTTKANMKIKKALTRAERVAEALAAKLANKKDTK
jgi:hypothetical protein